MQATTVRLEAPVKKDLDRLQGLILSETGDRLSHSQLLARLLRFTRRHEAQFFEERNEPEWRPPTPDELRHLQSGIKDWGFETDSSKIDDVLYGGDQP